MELTNIPTEAFDYDSIRNAYLDVQNWVNIPTDDANAGSRQDWLDIFTLVPFGLKIFDARLYSPELEYADVVAMNVPVGWPGRVYFDEEENPHIKKMWQYTRVEQSLLDPTKAMLQYGRLMQMPTYVDHVIQRPFNFHMLEHDEVKAYYILFSGFSTFAEAKEWYATNVTDVE